MLNVKCHCILIVILKLAFKSVDISKGLAVENEHGDRKKELLMTWMIKGTGKAQINNNIHGLELKLPQQIKMEN